MYSCDACSAHSREEHREPSRGKRPPLLIHIWIGNSCCWERRFCSQKRLCQLSECSSPGTAHAASRGGRLRGPGSPARDEEPRTRRAPTGAPVPPLDGCRRGLCRGGSSAEPRPARGSAGEQGPLTDPAEKGQGSGVGCRRRQGRGH